MPLFMVQFSFAQSSVKGMTTKPSDRQKAAVAALAPLGAKMKDYYFTLGDYDAMLIYEADGPITAAAIAMTLGASGAMSQVRTTPLMTTKEGMAAMKLSGETQGAYKPAGS